MPARTRATVLAPALCVLFILSSCHTFRYGTAVDSFPPALTAKGVLGDIVTIQTKYRAELIEVRDAGIVILAKNTFRLVPYSTIRSSRFEGVSASFTNR